MASQGKDDTAVVRKEPLQPIEVKLSESSASTKVNHRILFAVTTAGSVSFLERQLGYLQEQGYEVFVMCDGKPTEKMLEGATHIEWAIHREISLLHDVKSMWNAIRIIRRIKPDIVNMGTPKAGLIISIAAWLCRVPVRIYTCHGLRFETLRGWKRTLMMTTERIASACAHKVISVGSSLRKSMIRHQLCAPQKIEVLHHGSCKGVHVERFTVTDERQQQAVELRQSLDIPLDSPVIGFIGRITKDKGVDLLVDAFQMVKKIVPNAILLLVGEQEKGDPISAETEVKIKQDASIIGVGFQTNLALYYACMDCFVLPTYREGFPSVLLEASAAGRPIVATRATGVEDGLLDGITGLIVEMGDIHALAERLIWLLKRPQECVRLGVNGRMRVLNDFEPEDIVRAHERFYRNLHEQLIVGKGDSPHQQESISHSGTAKGEG